jgi:hypothetical protein
VKKRLTLEIEDGEEGGDMQLEAAINAYSFVIVISNIREHLRRLYKYEDKNEVSIEELQKFISDEVATYDLERFFA